MVQPLFVRIGLIIIIGSMLGALAVAGVSTSPSPLRGLILVQAEAHGEAWYIVPESGKRLYLGTPREALIRLRAVGAPVTSEAIDRIPEAGSIFARVTGEHINQTAKKYLGTILLRADHAPYDAWYVHPITGTRYPLASPRDAFRVMRDVALGITDNDIAHIPIETLAEDLYPIALESLASERRSIIPGRTPFAVSANTIERMERFALDPSASKAVADTYIILSIDRTPVIVYPRYHRWFILGPQGSADSFRLIGLLAGSGTLYTYKDISSKNGEHGSVLYGLYTPAEKESVAPLLLLEQGGEVLTLEIGIIATEMRYPAIDSKSAALFLGPHSPIFSGILLTDSTAAYVFQKGKLARLVGADRSTLQAWEEGGGLTVFGDTHGLYATDRAGGVYRIPVSDPLTVGINLTKSSGTVVSFRDAEGDFYVDPANGRIRRVQQWDGEGVQRVADGIVVKDGQIYMESPLAKAPIPLEGVSADSFFSVPQSGNTLYSDGATLYYRQSANPSPEVFALSSFDLASFEFLAKTNNGILVKDHNGVYTVSSRDGLVAQIKDSDAQSFRLLYADGAMLVAKDANHVFAGDMLRQVSGADAASFHIVFTVEGIPFGRDRNAIYYALPRDPTTFHRLTGADPSSFVIRTIPAAEPALRTLAYKGLDAIVYATDREWIWFYDGKRDGLLVIRRADQNEKVSDAQIIDFARMYANAVP